jgi:hypothetical protein
MKLFLSPHNDDAVLFGAYTLLRENPLVLTVMDSYLQVQRGAAWCNKTVRRMEDISAVHDVLGCPICFGEIRDDKPDWEEVETGFLRFEEWGLRDPILQTITRVYAPAVEENGHEHHNKIGELALKVWGDRVQPYLTYTRSGGKSTNGIRVLYDPEWPDLKRKALGCYQSQIRHPACAEHFSRSLDEYYAHE